MADMDLDDLDGLPQAPTRTTKFAPKNSKFKPKPKTEPVSSEPPSLQKSQELDSIPLSTKEDLDLDLDFKQPPIDAATTSIAKTEYEQPQLASAAANGVVKMDVEAKPESEQPKEDLMEEDGDEDQVVREIDVFFTPPPIDSNTQLYVLQYPLKPCWRPYELDERCEEVRVKPISAEVEIDLSVDVDSKNYDPNADNRVRMTKQILSSSWKPPRTTGYAVGVLLGNKLHLNPIQAVVQLRPSMQHLKSGGSRKKSSVTSHVEDVIKSEELKEEKSVGPSKKQNKLPGPLNETNKDIGECWVPLKYHGATSDVSARYLQKMVAQEGSQIQFSMSLYDYVNSFCPGTSNHDIIPRVPSRRFLLSLPLEDRYKTWLLEGPPVHRFDALKHLAPDYSVEDVFEVLQKLAQLIQGLWVPKSSLLYGIGQGVDSLARDYILLLFRENLVINDAKLPKKRQLAPAMNGILNVLAVERPSFHDWKFKEPPDKSFIKLYPDIVEEQNKAFESLEEQIINHIFGPSGPGINNSSKPNMVDRPGTSKNPNKGASKTANGAPSRAPMSDETREALPKALQKLFQTHKVCSFQQICQRLREMAVSESSRPKGVAREAIAAANGVDAPSEELLAVISEVATNINGVFVSKSSPDYPQYDALRKVVIDLLIAQGPKGKLKKSTIVTAALMQLERDVPNNEYQKVLNELCVSQGGAWVLKRGDGNPK